MVADTHPPDPSIWYSLGAWTDTVLGTTQYRTDQSSTVHSSYTGSFEAHYLVSTVPLPSALWLFGSGLLGLIGIAGRKKAVMSPVINSAMK
jgi:hypothetical protein